MVPANGGPHRLALQQTIRALEDACLAAANAIELHVARPRAVQRVRNALKLWPSGSMDNDRLVNKLNGPSFRRIARAHGFDYDLLRPPARDGGGVWRRLARPLCVDRDGQDAAAATSR